MKPKIDIGKLISKLKSNPKPSIKLNQVINPNPYRERDMRQEAMDIGAHQAKDYFGGNDARPV